VKIFSDETAKSGESYSSNCNNGSILQAFEDDPNDDTLDVRKKDDPEELTNNLHPQKSLCYPLSGETKDKLLQGFKDKQAFKLDNFNASILVTVMEQQ
jgi:hypothetical protein